MTYTHSDNVLINDSADEVQLVVQGSASQSESLQQWKDDGGDVLSQVDAEGHLQVGDVDGTIDSLIESHNIEDASKPARGLHTKGILTGALSSLVSWAVSELGLKGTGGLSALHRALRVQATNENTGAMGSGADVRAGDFEAINIGGNGTSNNLEMSALVAKVNNQSGATLDKAYGLKVEMVDDGSSNEAYAIHTDQGKVRLGDVLELADDSVHAPLSITPRSSAPSTPQVNHIYLHEISAGDYVWRRYNGSAWEDVGVSSEGSNSDNVSNESSVVGATVTDALNTLNPTKYILEGYHRLHQNSDSGLRQQTITAYTADQCVGGTAGGTIGSASNAFDDDQATRTSGVPPRTIEYTFSSSKTIRQYNIRAYNSGASPKNWTVEYFDGSSWQIASTVTSETGWSSNEIRTYDVDTAYSSTQWRLNITANNGGTNVHIEEIEMMEAATIDDGADKLAQSFQLDNTEDVYKAAPFLKKVGTPTGTLTLRIETDNSGSPSGTLVDSNATATISEASLGTSYGFAEFAFVNAFVLSGNTPYWLVLSTDRATNELNYVDWGSDSTLLKYLDGEMKSELSSVWSSQSKDAIFQILGNGSSGLSHYAYFNSESSYSTQSTSYVPMDSNNLKATLDITTGKVEVTFSARVSESGGYNETEHDIYIDDAVYASGGTSLYQSRNDLNQNEFTVTTIIDELDIGEHTFELHYKESLDSSDSTSTYVSVNFTVKEIP